jgi:hypothetical protein
LSTTSGARKRTTYPRSARAANAVLALVAASIIGCKPPPTHETEIGQWIWSATDSARFAEASRTIPNVIPPVWIGTIRGSRSGAVQGTLALSPRIAGRPSVGVVIRFDDSFTNVWASQSDNAIANAVGGSLSNMLSAAETADVSITEVQLDYDCPERLLRRWSVVVAQLSRDALGGRAVWITSLVAHVRHTEYGELFRPHVAGHILQVFDTGDRMSLPNVRRIERLASRHRMPFRLGVAAFERRLTNGRTTNHQAWFEATRVMNRSRWYSGVWVFPGGASWAQLLEPKK